MQKSFVVCNINECALAYYRNCTKTISFIRIMNMDNYPHRLEKMNVQNVRKFNTRYVNEKSP